MEIKNNSIKFFQEYLVPKDTTLAGYAAIVQYLGLNVLVRNHSYISNSHIKGSIKKEEHWNIYDKRYMPEETLDSHIKFALKHEILDLLVLKRIFQNIPKNEFEKIIIESPIGIYNRRLWFLYEFLMEESLDIPDAPNVGTIELLDSNFYFTIEGQLSKRHRVKNNLLGTNKFCPLIRKTETLNEYINLNLSENARQIIGKVSKQLITRAASFMLLADSRASYEIEGERPPRDRLERWAKAITQAGKNPLNVEEIDRVHSILIADRRFITPGLRTDGVFIGERDSLGYPLPEFIGAKAEDLDYLISGLTESNNLMLNSGIDAVLNSAVIAFGFVYIHPLQDGNGRLHRYLIHHVLAEKQFTPLGLIFPVSSVMQNHIDDYKRVLRDHSAPLMNYIEWKPTLSGNVEVTNETKDLYCYSDYTEEAEFIYSCVKSTIEKDLPQELDYLQRHERAMQRISGLIELPDRLAQDFIMFTLNNNGKLPNARRKKIFKGLTEQEVNDLQSIINEEFEDFNK